ncbi:MAG: cysteine desulfurase NifS [Candidatus Bathyarchaeia archaeon]
MRRVYMDYQAATPVDERVLKAMEPYLTTSFGNPSSLHSQGQEAREAIEDARSKVARLIGAANPEEVIFTSGGTESNNLALKGIAARSLARGNHLVTTTIEHISIVNISKHLEKQGFRVSRVPVDHYGTVDLEKLQSEINEKTILVSVMYANGEIGTIEPIREIGEVCEERGVPFHVDAVAAAGLVPLDVRREKIDLLTLSSNDMYGPKGVGALYIAEGVRLIPLLHGGGQERGLRSGSENVPGIVGMGAAAELAQAEMEGEARRLTALRDRLIKGVLETVPSSFLNGHPVHRLPNNANLSFSYVEGESLILGLDMEGIAASSGSACTSKTLEPSHVLTAIGLPHEQAHGSLLFSLGRGNTEEDVEYVLEVLPGIVKRLRMISPLTPKGLLA